MDTSANGSSSDECKYASAEFLLHILLFLYLLLIPLFLCVVYMAYKQRQKQQSFSHSDIFTLNIIGMEVLVILGSTIYVTGVKFGVEIESGGHLFTTGVIGQMCFHCLTCVERYLAVVHPIMYLRLKKRGGVTMRNGTIAGAWVLSGAFGILEGVFKKMDENVGKICKISLAFFFFVIVAFCSIAVLCALIRPGPGEGGGEPRCMDRSKQRAFVMIAAIFGVLLLRFTVLSIDYLAYILQVFDANGLCLTSLLSALFDFPSSLVLPLMFLQKRSIVNCKTQLKGKK